MARKPAVTATPADLDQVSLDQLLAFAREYRLVDAHESDGERVALYAGDDVIRLPVRHAAPFVAGMLRSRGWYLLEERRAAGEDGPLDATHPSSASRPAPGGTPDAVESVMDALLAYAHEEQLLLGYEKDTRVRRVALHIPACRMVLSYAEALDFLFDCVQERAADDPD